jgi:hypothetical protein
MSENTPIVEFLEEFQEILDEASVVGLVFLEEQQYVLLLGILALSWRPVITSSRNQTPIKHFLI